MDYRIDLAGPPPDTAALTSVLQRADPAALADLDPQGGDLRIATSLAVDDLSALLNEAGLPTDARHIVLQPSVCCGGCSG
jgi:hypothetical protein